MEAAAVAASSEATMASVATGKQAAAGLPSAGAVASAAGAVRVRPGLVRDCECIAAFNEETAWVTEARRLDPATARAGALRVLTDASKGFYLVAEACEPARDAQVLLTAGEGEAQIVGSCMVTLEWSDWSNRDIWWLQSVYVVPKYRGRGVFRALYNAVRERCIQDPMAAPKVRLYVEKENLAAQAVYAKVGMAEARYLFFEENLSRAKDDATASS
jgi:ribosomal protein S18 acetylase RimI-like enzyme